MLMSPSKLNPSSTREVWLARKVAKTVTSSQKLARQVLHLPCLRTSGSQGSDKLQILNSNRKSLYCYMEQREGEQPNNEDASYYTLYYILIHCQSFNFYVIRISSSNFLNSTYFCWDNTRTQNATNILMTQNLQNNILNIIELTSCS